LVVPIKYNYRWCSGSLSTVSVLVNGLNLDNEMTYLFPILLCGVDEWLGWRKNLWTGVRVLLIEYIIIYNIDGYD
jgi:hypothetical protein